MHQLNIYWHRHINSIYMVAELKKLDDEKFFHLGMEVSVPAGVSDEEGFNFSLGDLTSLLHYPVHFIDSNYMLGRGEYEYARAAKYNKYVAEISFDPAGIADGLIESEKKLDAIVAAIPADVKIEADKKLHEILKGVRNV